VTAPAATPDSAWIVGHCWLYCGRPDVLVTWIGPASARGITMPMHACGPCIRHLADLVWSEAARQDRAGTGLSAS